MWRGNYSSIQFLNLIWIGIYDFKYCLIEMFFVHPWEWTSPFFSLTIFQINTHETWELKTDLVTNGQVLRKDSGGQDFSKAFRETTPSPRGLPLVPLESYRWFPWCCYSYLADGLGGKWNPIWSVSTLPSRHVNTWPCGNGVYSCYLMSTSTFGSVGVFFVKQHPGRR